MGWAGATAVVVGLAAAPVRAEEPRLVPERLYDAGTVLARSEVPSGPGVAIPSTGKNPRLAMLYSLLLPGLGEAYLGHDGRAKAFFVAEGAIWTSFAVFRIQGGHRKDLYQEFAEIHAGVPVRDDDEYYRIIGNYVASDGPFSANERIRQEARAAFPNNPDAQDAYFQEHAYLGDDAWSWGSAEEMERYRSMRDASIDAFHRSTFSVGLALANRILSVVDTGILGSKFKTAGDKAGLSWDVAADPRGSGARILVTKAF
jgi:hypothetical protein